MDGVIYHVCISLRFFFMGFRLFWI
jgi:hypothetical protein